MLRKLAVAFFALALALAPINAFAGVKELQQYTGPLTANSTSSEVQTKRATTATVFLDISTLTLADADDEVDFYIQTTYDGVSWTDVENVHFTDADNGATPQRVIVIDGEQEGPGTILALTGTDPAPAAEISETIPANQIWRLFSMEAALTTDGSGTPTVAITVDDGTSVHFRMSSASNQPISVTEQYVIGPFGMTRVESAGVHVIPTPEGLLFAAGHRIQTTGITSGDDYAAPYLVVEAWHDASVSTDAAIGDNLKSYHRPLGSKVRVKVTVTGASAPTYAYTATVIYR